MMEDDLLEAIPVAPQPRKFSRLRKGGAAQNAAPQEAPIDENAAPNGGQAQPSLPTPASSPTGSRLPQADEAQPSTAAEQEASEGARDTAAEVLLQAWLHGLSPLCTAALIRGSWLC